MLLSTNQRLLLQIITQPGDKIGVTNQLTNLNRENWQDLQKEATLHGLIPLLYTSLEQVSEEVKIPAEVFNSLKESYLTNAVRNLHFLHHGKQVFNTLNQAGIPAIGLKGIYLLDNVYQDIALRTMSDLDIMVKKNDILPALEIIQSLGYRPTTYFNIEDKNFDIKHVPPYMKENGPYLELHWTLLSENEPFPIDVDALWQRAIPFNIAGTQALSLCIEDLILHLCLHLTYQHNLGTGLSRLFDIWQLLQEQSANINWNTLINIAQTWQTKKVTALTFHLAKTLFNADIPSEAISMLIAERIPEEMLKLALSQLLMVEPVQANMTPDLANLTKVDGLLAKIRLVLSRIFLPKRIIARLYNTNPKSPKVFFYFFVRTWELIRDYTHSTWSIIRKHDRALHDVTQTQAMLQLRKWLGEN